MQTVSKLLWASSIAIVAASGLAQTGYVDFVAPAFAATDGEGDDGSGGPDNSKGNQGGQGQGSQGAQAGQDNQGGSGSGQGGPDDSSDSKGPQAGGPADTGSGGGKPVWAQEGIPEIELGRLSVARSPEHVLARALDEAEATLTAEMVEFYNQSLDDIITDLSLNFDDVSFFDSPLQNLALFADILDDGETVLDGVNDRNDQKLLAVFLGTASDKTLEISEDTVIAMITILGDNMDDPISVDTAQLALDAEAVRIAVLAGHG